MKAGSSRRDVAAGWVRMKLRIWVSVVNAFCGSSCSTGTAISPIVSFGVVSESLDKGLIIAALKIVPTGILDGCCMIGFMGFGI